MTLLFGLQRSPYIVHAARDLSFVTRVLWAGTGQGLSHYILGDILCVEKKILWHICCEFNTSQHPYYCMQHTHAVMMGLYKSSFWKSYSNPFLGPNIHTLYWGLITTTVTNAITEFFLIFNKNEKKNDLTSVIDRPGVEHEEKFRKW